MVTVVTDQGLLQRSQQRQDVHELEQLRSQVPHFCSWSCTLYSGLASATPPARRSLKGDRIPLVSHPLLKSRQEVMVCVRGSSLAPARQGTSWSFYCKFSDSFYQSFPRIPWGLRTAFFAHQKKYGEPFLICDLQIFSTAKGNQGQRETFGAWCYLN